MEHLASSADPLRKFSEERAGEGQKDEAGDHRKGDKHEKHYPGCLFPCQLPLLTAHPRLGEGLSHAVIDQLGRPPVLVGASLGGISAILAEGVSDREVSSGLVIVDVVHRPSRSGVERIQEFMRSGLRGFATLEDAADAIAAYAPHRPKRVNPAGLMEVLGLRPDGRWYWHWDPKFLATRTMRFPARSPTFLENDVRPRLPRPRSAGEPRRQ